MADGKLTIDKFIEKFKVDGYRPAIIDDIIKLNDINLAQDFFIKGLDDINFFPYVLPKIRKVFSNGVQFLTWIEHKGKSFWLFPVIFYKNNDLTEMINGVHSIIELRKMVIKLYNNDVSSEGKIDNNIKVGILGNYSEKFDKLNSPVDERSLYLRRRQTKIIVIINYFLNAPIYCVFVNRRSIISLRDYAHNSLVGKAKLAIGLVIFFTTYSGIKIIVYNHKDY